MLIYKTLGPSAQEEFAKTWGVGYALNNASEWRAYGAHELASVVRVCPRACVYFVGGADA